MSEEVNKKPHWRVTVEFILPAETEGEAHAVAEGIMRTVVEPHQYYDARERRVYVTSEPQGRTPSQTALRLLEHQVGGRDATTKHLAAQLRTLADHLESGRYPLPFGISRSLASTLDWTNITQGELMADFTVTLSHPWPG